MNNTVEIEPTDKQDRDIIRAKVISFCRDNGLMYEETTDSVIVIIPLFKPFKLVRGA